MQINPEGSSMNAEKKQELCARMADQLPVLRKEMGATQVSFAEMAGLTRSTVFRIERSKTMSWNTFLSLLMVFSQHRATARLLRALDLFPEELSSYFNSETAAEA